MKFRHFYSVHSLCCETYKKVEVYHNVELIKLPNPDEKLHMEALIHHLNKSDHKIPSVDSLVTRYLDDLAEPRRRREANREEQLRLKQLNEALLKRHQKIQRHFKIFKVIKETVKYKNAEVAWKLVLANKVGEVIEGVTTILKDGGIHFFLSEAKKKEYLKKVNANYNWMKEARKHRKFQNEQRSASDMPNPSLSLREEIAKSWTLNLDTIDRAIAESVDKIMRSAGILPKKPVLYVLEAGTRDIYKPALVLSFKKR